MGVTRLKVRTRFWKLRRGTMVLRPRKHLWAAVIIVCLLLPERFALLSLRDTRGAVGRMSNASISPPPLVTPPFAKVPISPR